jgi:hypothetical protein
MVSVTLSIPKETRELMDNFPEMNWSGFIRVSLEQKAKELSWRGEMLKKLKEEQEFTGWAVKTTRSGRAQRLAELKKKGLI